MSKDYGVITPSRNKTSSVMSKDEVEAVLESMLAPIKNRLEETVTEESMTQTSRTSRQLCWEKLLNRKEKLMH